MFSLAMTITAAQVRGARSMLRWSLKRLAHAAEVSPVTISRFETELAVPIPSTRNAIQRALEGAGIEFQKDGGVRLRK
jgi:transcriptional regulator with XRE-family HTH domain